MPGHSPCHIALNDENAGTLVIGDATGFYVAAKDALWPNYFESLENYCHSIQKLSTLPADRLVLSHNGVVETGARAYFEKVMKVTKRITWKCWNGWLMAKTPMRLLWRRLNG